MIDTPKSENRIGSERTRIRMSQVQLAAYLNVSNKTVSTWEAGKSNCPSEELVKLAKLFGCSLDYLMAISNERLPKSINY